MEKWYEHESEKRTNGDDYGDDGDDDDDGDGDGDADSKGE